MRVERTATERGVRLTVHDRGSETLRAELSEGHHAGAVTVYWRGRVNLEHLFSFFDESCPPASAPSFGAVVFRPNDRVRVNGLTSLGELRRRMPMDACLVRLEHSSADRETAKSPDFIVWSRVDLAAAEGESGPDFIGISAAPSWLDSITEPLTKFVSATHTDHIRQGTARHSMHRILQNPPKDSRGNPSQALTELPDDMLDKIVGVSFP